MRKSAPILIAAATGAAFAYGMVLAMFFVRGAWIRDPGGHAVVTDFLPVYVAGRLAWVGHAAIAYDWRAFHQVQTAFVGHPFAGFLGWHYPPLFFVVAMVLASLPYTVAFLGWVSVTLTAFAIIVARIARQPAAIACALALPPTLACAMVGQNGFFTAALLGAMLLALPRRPLLAGVLLAALTFKPQFGILIPFALIAGGHWRALLVAAVLTATWIGIGYGIAPDAFAGFLHYLPETSRAVLGQGASGWYKLQSPYAATRLLGGSDSLGWTVQICVAVLAAAFCVWVWRKRDASFALKAACLAIGALLATPYVYFYDLPILAVPLAFLFRDRAFDRRESLVIALVVILLVACALVPAPLGLVATMLVAALAIQRMV